MFTRKVDISELYDVLCREKETYVLCFDITGLLGINQISRQAGDLAIVECLKRIDENSGENMLLFRIGGDEFALVTCLRDPQAVRETAGRILSHNGETIHYQDQLIPISMWAGAAKIHGTALRYVELFEELHQTIDKAHQQGGDLWIKP